MDERRGVDELDGDRGAQDAGALAVGGRAGGHEHEQRAQALAAGGDRRARVLAQHRAVRGGDLGQARLEPLEHPGDVRAPGLDHRGDGLGGGHQATVPEWMAMMPPAVRIQRTSLSPARDSAPPSASGPGKRFTDLGRYV